MSVLVGEPPPAQRKRPDVAARKAANKLLDITVVKSTLNKVGQKRVNTWIGMVVL